MPTLRNNRKLAAVSKEKGGNTSNNWSQNALNPGMDEDCNTPVPEEIDERVTKKLSQEFSPVESLILDALSKPDELLPNP